MEKIIAARETETEEENQRDSVLPIPLFPLKMPFILLAMGSANSRIPNTLATDSWKLTDSSTKGFVTSIHSTAKERLVRLSYSSFTAPPKAMSPHIRQALVTEGEKPVTPAKNSSNGTETRKVSHLRPRKSR